VPSELPAVELVPQTPEDEWVTVALETGPGVMAELGGPWTAEEARATHQRRMAYIRDGAWSFTVRPASDPQTRDPVGTIGVWASEWEGEPVSETGWMTLPEHQGKGYASAALAAILDRERAEHRWGDIHAFPGATNGPSNALCRKFGFELVGGGDADYAGRHFPVNHWVWRAPNSGENPDESAESAR
jgi:RimJ/RimL family protein N-acetyltransferase